MSDDLTHSSGRPLRAGRLGANEMRRAHGENKEDEKGAFERS
jgi:hypothetical protein